MKRTAATLLTLARRRARRAAVAVRASENRGEYDRRTKADGSPVASAERPTPPAAARWSGFERREDRFAEVVAPAGRSLHHFFLE